MEHGSDDIAHLFQDFKASLDCEVTGQPYSRSDGPMKEVPVRGKCPNPAVSWISWRACDCMADIRRWQELNPGVPITHGPKIAGGLCVVGLPMCQSHIDYFTKYILYPFTCPKCGVSYLQAGEMLIAGDDL